MSGERSIEDRVGDWSQIWRVAHPVVSWALGCGLLLFVTVSGAGNQSPEWYAVIGGLLGGPFLTFCKEGRKKAAAEKNGTTGSSEPDSSVDGGQK